MSSGWGRTLELYQSTIALTAIIEMKRMNKLLKKITIILLAISFVSVGIVAIWVILMASVVASVFFLFDSGGKWFQQPYFYRLEGRRHHPHAAT